MKFNLSIIETALYYAVEKSNIEIIKLLLANNKIDINIQYIFYTNYTHTILKDIFQ